MVPGADSPAGTGGTYNPSGYCANSSAFAITAASSLSAVRVRKTLLPSGSFRVTCASHLPVGFPSLSFRGNTLPWPLERWAVLTFIALPIYLFLPILGGGRESLPHTKCGQNAFLAYPQPSFDTGPLCDPPYLVGVPTAA